MAGTPGSNFIPSGEIVEIKSGENSSEGGYSPWIMHPGSPPSEGYPGQGPFLSLADMYSNLDIEIQVDNWKRTFSPEELAPGRKITQIDMNYDFVTVTSNDSLSQNTDFLDDLYMAHGRYPYPIPNVDPEIIEGAFDLTRCRFAQ